MVVVNRVQVQDNKNNGENEEQKWENPKAPEQASDPRDIEQLERQKKEAEMRKNNLSDPEEDE
ncbi:hypothetical protein [Arcticibacter sp. MXS-1]|uniref:hypothetical protein n=1 Tax=Arcticibacter sp. MXS-1 TaxID=3341726 RepID=UPI0035A9A533